MFVRVLLFDIDHRIGDKMKNYSGKRNLISDRKKVREQPVILIERSKNNTGIEARTMF